MSRLEDAKKKYDKTEIPKELSKRVQAAVEESGARKREREKVVRIRRRKVLAGKCAGVAAGLAIVFVHPLWGGGAAAGNGIQESIYGDRGNRGRVGGPQH